MSNIDKDKVSMEELILHTFISDMLPENHPLAFETLKCKKCKTMVHHCHNETMMTWIEAKIGGEYHVVCLECFAKWTALDNYIVCKDIKGWFLHDKLVCCDENLE